MITFKSLPEVATALSNDTIADLYHVPFSHNTWVMDQQTTYCTQGST